MGTLFCTLFYLGHRGNLNFGPLFGCGTSSYQPFSLTRSRRPHIFTHILTSKVLAHLQHGFAITMYLFDDYYSLMSYTILLICYKKMKVVLFSCYHESKPIKPGFSKRSKKMCHFMTKICFHDQPAYNEKGHFRFFMEG